MAAGKAALDLFDAAAVSRLAGLGDRLREGLTRTLADLGLAWRVQGYGSLATILPFKDPARDYRAFHGAMAAANAGSTMAAFHRGMVNRGILPTFPAAFILSTAMDEAVIDSIVGAARESLSEIRNGSAQAA
jgi:glutamate-1-semialdehyde aminotransferase